MKKRSIVLISLLFCVLCSCNSVSNISDERVKNDNIISPESLTEHTTIQDYYNSKVSGVKVIVKGEVIKMLEDDNHGSRHQRFIIALNNRKTLLIAHNIDLAPRIENLTMNDTVLVCGEYEWNERGGVIHWTHKDSEKKHFDGYVIHENKTYQ